jgi:hypothetical protein
MFRLSAAPPLKAMPPHQVRGVREHTTKHDCARLPLAMIEPCDYDPGHHRTPVFYLDLLVTSGHWRCIVPRPPCLPLAKEERSAPPFS